MKKTEQLARKKFQSALGKYFLDYRIKSNLTQTYVSENLGLKSPQFISNIERGLCSIPPEILKGLIRMYSIRKTDFLIYIVSLKMNYYQEVLSDKKKTS